IGGAVNFVLMLLAFALVVAGLIPSQAAPSSMGASAQRPAAHGVLRITRHPFNAGASLFGIAHLLVKGALGDVLFFGGFPLFAWIGSRHQDERLARGKAGYRGLVADTSFLPLAALPAGAPRARPPRAAVGRVRGRRPPCPRRAPLARRAVRTLTPEVTARRAAARPRLLACIAMALVGTLLLRIFPGARCSSPPHLSDRCASAFPQ